MRIMKCEETELSKLVAFQANKASGFGSNSNDVIMVIETLIYYPVAARGNTETSLFQTWF